MVKHCSNTNCAAELSRSNKSGLCAKCYSCRGSADDNNRVDDDDILSDLEDPAGDTFSWAKMNKLLDNKFASQEEKIKKAVIAELNTKVTDLSNRQKKIEDDNKTFKQKMTAMETRQKNIEQEIQ